MLASGRSSDRVQVLVYQKALNQRTLNHKGVVKCQNFGGKFIIGDALTQTFHFGDFRVNQLPYRAVTRNVDMIFWTSLKNIFLNQTPEGHALIRAKE